MPLPHFTNIASHYQINEVVHKNLYEVVVNLPPAVASLHPVATNTVLLENTTSINLPTYPELGNKPQRFKYSTRIYVMLPESTSITDLSIKFNMNQNSSTYSVETWRIMKDWYDLAWNNEDGSTHYKRNMIADIVCHVHDKEGHVIRRVTWHNCQITSFAGWQEMSWDTNEIVDFTAKFVADYWEDLYY